MNGPPTQRPRFNRGLKVLDMSPLGQRWTGPTQRPRFNRGLKVEAEAAETARRLSANTEAPL